MTRIITASADTSPQDLTAALENGDLVLLPDEPFAIRPDEESLIDPVIFSGESKNVSYNPANGKLGGVALEGEALELCRSMVSRYADFAAGLLKRVAPGYEPAMQRRRTSFRPGEVAVRVLSPRKDDRLLHVDAFPANPTQGRRILRVFTNVHPEGRARHWRLGEKGFGDFASEFRSRLKPGPAPGLATAMAALSITKGRRTAYDHAMLQLHDLGKLDAQFQASTPSQEVMLPAGASWIVYTDSVLHAALAGQHAFEQTYLLPPEGMSDPSKAPVRVLEKMLDRRLV